MLVRSFSLRGGWMAAAVWIGLVVLSMGRVWAGPGDVQPVPPLTARVIDLTHTLSSAQQAALAAHLRALEASKGVQIAVLMVGTTQPESIEQYALRVVESWRLGRSNVDDGVLVLVAKDDKKVRIEVGYGLEGVLTDLVAQRIIVEHMTPRFRQDDFAGGLAAGVAQMERVVVGESLPAPVRATQRQTEGAGEAWPWVLIVVVFLGGILSRILGRLVGSLVVGGVVGTLVGLTKASLLTALGLGFVGFLVTLVGVERVFGRGGLVGGMGRGGGWSTGAGGGFGGGGGSFGGGGSSGSW